VGVPPLCGIEEEAGPYEWAKAVKILERGVYRPNGDPTHWALLNVQLSLSDLRRLPIVVGVRVTSTLTDLDPNARVPPLRPLLPEWRNWQTQGT
jgi:hypothetical protein